ncbi:MAG: S8 family serine peptidase [Pseudomonadota bacterium]
MKLFSVLVLGLSAFCAQAATPRYISNQYIVVLNKPVAGSLLYGLPVAEQATTLLSTVGGGRVLLSYEHALKGFAARISPAQAALLSLNPLVASITQDQIASAVATQNGATWGLDRVDQRNRPMDGKYVYPDSAGQGVHVYVIDTGLNVNHAEFTGRVGAGRNFADRKSASVVGGLGGTGDVTIDPANISDCNGHGTHVSGTATGTVYGVAKKATIHPVRALNCGGEGQYSWIIGAIDWTTANAVRPAVVNMSLGGGNDATLDAAVRNSIASGIAYAVAAGNDNADACTGSPNRVAEAVTVGASTNADSRDTSYSNFGSCLDIFAPGTDITSSWYTNNTATSTIDGTSMASPHVAGALALILARNPSQTPAQLAAVLVSESTSGVLSNAGTGSPNKLLYVANTGGGTPTDNPPQANYTFSCNGLTCSFDAGTSSDDKGIAAYGWAFGDGSNGNGVTTSRTYAAGGSYNVTLTVTDTIGQTGTSQKTVTATAPGGNAPCTNCTKYSGSLASDGTAYHPGDTGFSYAGGTLKGYLRGPASGADFDLFLEKKGTGLLGGTSWSIVGRGETTSSNENVSYSAASGTYRWRVKSYSGAGAYDFYGEPK